MAKLLVYMDDERHQDLKELAHRHKTTMADLVRYAIDKTFEDQLDVISGERSLEEYLGDPSSAVSLDDLLREMDVALPNRRNKKGAESNPSDAEKRRSKDARSSRLAGR